MKNWRLHNVWNGAYYNAVQVEQVLWRSLYWNKRPKLMVTEPQLHNVKQRKELLKFWALERCYRFLRNPRPTFKTYKSQSSWTSHKESEELWNWKLDGLVLRFDFSYQQCTILTVKHSFDKCWFDEHPVFNRPGHAVYRRSMPEQFYPIDLYIL